MARFGRDRLPARSTLSRFLAAFTLEAVEALRTLFLEDLLERRSDFEQQPCGLTDRAGKRWKVFDIDGTLSESPLARTLYDCPDVPVGAEGQAYRLVVATHPKGSKKQRIGDERDGLIYELFLTRTAARSLYRIGCRGSLFASWLFRNRALR